MFVYLIVCDVTWKIYIGKTTGSCLTRYLKQKFYDAKHYVSLRSHLYKAIRKYGPEHFHIFPLFEGQTNREICEYEKLLIKSLKSQHPDIGYNICRGGEGFTGPHTSKTKEKIATASRKMWTLSEIRENFTKKMTGSHPNHTPEGLKAIHNGRLGKKASEETLHKLRDSHIGLTRSQESCNKQRDSVKGEKNHFFGKTHTLETRAKLRESRLRNLDKYPMPNPHKKAQT